MTFNSVVFLYFLLVVFCLYWFVFGRNLKLQNLFIVVASYVFYGWWDYRFLILIAATSLVSWTSGLLIHKYRGQGRTSRWISAANIVFNIGILGLFKYYDFFVQSFADLFLGGDAGGLTLNLILPVGISFYTFQALSYSIDVYKGKTEPTKDIIQFFAYVCFFPQLVAGPIERSTRLLPQFGQKRVFNYSDGVDGLRQMLWGFFKKIVIADSCAIYVNEVYGSVEAHSGLELIAATVLFAFQTYGDFSGYSDIAIGTAKLFGIKLTRNFATPYFSRNFREYWRRWHISLMTWFRDYLYFPLGGSRCSKAKTVRNIFIVFITCALWHGASWNMVLWGTYFALLVIPVVISGKGNKYKDVVAQDRALPSLKELWQMGRTFFLLNIALVIFRTSNFSQTLFCYRKMFTLESSDISSLFYEPFLTSIPWILLMLLVEWTDRREEHGLTMRLVHSKVLRCSIYFVLALIILLYFDDGSPEFIYFQF